MIPNFTTGGMLPPGIHWATLSEVKIKLCFSAKRKTLVSGLELAISSLKTAGCSVIYIDGSFSTNKLVPNDIDVCWDMNGVDLNLLKSIDPVLFDFSFERAAQKRKFGCEFFPANSVAAPPNTLYIDFFQEDRDGIKKGIVGLKI